MSFSEYIVTFESILYGLIVSQFFVGWNKMIRDRKTFQKYWAFTLLSLCFFLLIVFVYKMGFYSERFEDMNTNVNFLLLSILPPSLFATISYQLFPKSFKNVNLREYILENKYIIFVPFLIYALLISIYYSYKEYMAKDAIQPAYYLSYFLIVLFTFYLFKLNSRRLEILVVLFSLLIFIAYIKSYIPFLRG